MSKRVMILFGVALLAIAAAVFFLRQDLKEEFGCDEPLQDEDPEPKKTRKKKTGTDLEEEIKETIQEIKKTIPAESVAVQ